MILRTYSVWLIWINWTCLSTIAIWWPWPNIPDPRNWVYLRFVLHPKRSLYSSTYRLLESHSYSKSYLPLWSLISVIFLLSDVTLLNLCQVLPLKTKSVIYIISKNKPTLSLKPDIVLFHDKNCKRRGKKKKDDMQHYVLQT